MITCKPNVEACLIAQIELYINNDSSAGIWSVKQRAAMISKLVLNKEGHGTYCMLEGQVNSSANKFRSIGQFGVHGSEVWREYEM